MQAKGLCAPHYMRERRGSKGTDLRASPGEGELTTHIVVRCSDDLKASVEAAADREGIDPSALVRRAIVNELKAKRTGRPAPRLLEDDGTELTIPGPGGPKR